MLLCLTINIIQEDQQGARECYISSLETSKEDIALVNVHSSEVPSIYFECWDSILGAEVETLTTTQYLKEVHIGPHAHQVTKICISVSIMNEQELVDRLIKNVIVLTLTMRHARHIHKGCESSPRHPPFRPLTQREKKICEKKSHHWWKGVETI